jgi:two-component system chemotaxis response regulator CheB
MAIKLLIVDDSALMRKKISALFQDAGDFIVQTAGNGSEAIAKNLTFEPDVVTLDINMPELDGLTALAEMMLQRPVPVVMVSSLTAQGKLATLEAMALGAVDVITKPDGTISLALEQIEQELLTKVRVAAKAKVHVKKTSAPLQLGSAKPKAAIIAHHPPEKLKKMVSQPRQRPTESPDDLSGLVLIGVSTGGPGTLELILRQLPANFPFPIVVAQHMPGAFTGAFASRLNTLCALTVQEVSSLQRLETGFVYIARGDADIVLTQRAGILYLQPKPEDPRYRWHPSVELLGRSALEVCDAQAMIAVMLTGMGDDGAEAFSQIHACGGRTIAESEASAVVFGMPKELIQRRGATLVLSADKIAQQLQHWVCS